MIISQVAPTSVYNMSKPQKFANAVGRFIPSKISSFFEMGQSGALSRVPLLMLSVFFVLGARYFKSRDAHEKREVLTRDGATIGVAMLGVPIVKNWMQRGIDKISKIPVATEKNKFFALNDLGFDNVKNWYGKADLMPEKALGVAKLIQEKGGDVAKAFSKLGDEAKAVITTMLQGKEYNSQNIVSSLGDAFKSSNPETKTAFNSLTKILSSVDNGLVKSAQVFKAIPNIFSLVTITALLGYGIPAFNIRQTRKKIKQGNPHLNSPHLAAMLEPRLSEPQKSVISSFFNS